MQTLVTIEKLLVLHIVATIPGLAKLLVQITWYKKIIFSISYFTVSLFYYYDFLKLKFWELLNNSWATFDLENENLLRNPNINFQHGVAYIKRHVWENLFCQAKYFLLIIGLIKTSFLSSYSSSVFTLVRTAFLFFSFSLKTVKLKN